MDIVELKKNDQIVENRHPWESARLEVVRQFIDKKLKYPANSNETILDIGSGDIFVTTNLADHYKNTKFLNVDIAYTYDLIEKLTESINNKNIFLYESMQKAALDNNGSVSIIFLLDVIEHIEDDITFLKNIQNSSLINEDTKFIITVPAYKSLFSNHDVFLKHFRRYTTRMLKKHVEEAGLKVIETGYFFSLLVIPRIFNLAKEKLSKSKTIDTEGVSNWQGSKFLTQFIKNILIVDYKINQIFKKIKLQIPGLSCYIICTIA